MKRFYCRPILLALLTAAMAAVPAYAASLSEAQNLLDQGLYDKALEQANSLLRSDSKNDEARFVQAVAQAQLGQASEAIANFAALAERNPDSPEPANNLAVLYAKQGEYEKARRWLESAMATHPAYATAHRNLGDVYTALAAVAYSRALDQQQSSDLGVELEMVNGFLVSAGKSPTALAQSAQAQPVAPSQPRPVQPSPAQAPYRLPQSQQPVAAATPQPAQPAQAASRPVPPVASAPQQAPATAPVPPPAPAQPAVAQQQPVAPAQPTTRAAAPATAPVAQTDQKQAILNVVESWATAWSSQDVDGYLNSYAENFYPGDGLSLPQWKAQRRARVGKPGDISVRVINPQTTLQGQDRASVSFRQAYESANYSDQVRKTLELQRKAEGWKIVREVSEPL